MQQAESIQNILNPLTSTASITKILNRQNVWMFLTEGLLGRSPFHHWASHVGPRDGCITWQVEENVFLVSRTMCLAEDSGTKQPVLLNAQLNTTLWCKYFDTVWSLLSCQQKELSGQGSWEQRTHRSNKYRVLKPPPTVAKVTYNFREWCQSKRLWQNQWLVCFVAKNGKLLRRLCFCHDIGASVSYNIFF